tara:strand:+ start:16176 stop:17000 length:825 start_codon:yes stop_codon:yes gene_type:complete
MSTIKVLQEDIRLRPSSIDSFFGCAFQWGKHFLEGESSIPNDRAAIGTSIHAGAEQVWLESISAGTKVVNLDMMNDAAVEAYEEEEQKGLQLDEGVTKDDNIREIIAGNEAFAEDIVPYAQIPSAVETFLKVDLDHALVSELGGTIDYLTPNTIADLKTSKRKPTVANYVTQQSIYTYLGLANGYDIKHNLIQSVVLKKVPEGMILPMEAQVDQTKKLVNIMLDTLDIVHKDIIPIETILRPNPKYMFCSEKFCKFYGSCPATNARKVNTTVKL